MRQMFAVLRKSALLLIGSLVAISCGAQPASALWPVKPIRILVPYPPGGSADLLARAVGRELSTQVAQPVIIENRPGAGTVVGTLAAAKAPGDGYTLLVIANSFLMHSSIRSSPPYDAHGDFVPVSMLATVPQVIVVRRESPIDTVTKWMDIARQRGGAMTIASVGPGTTQQILIESLKIATGVPMTYVPFPGSAPAVTALLGGHVDVVLTTLPEALQHIQAGSLRAIVVVSPKRLDSLPNVPTLPEVGWRDLEFDVWFGLAAPRGTSDAVVRRLNSEVTRTLRATSVDQVLSGAGLVPVESSVESFSEFVRSIDARMTSVARRAGVKVE